MKKLIAITCLFIISSIFFVPPYIELNDLAIIDKIGIEQKENLYYVYLREVIPTKNNNEIKYQYKIYSIETNNLDNSLEQLQNKTKKKLYLDKVKSLTTNINTDTTLFTFFRRPKIIFHTYNVKKELGIKS